MKIKPSAAEKMSSTGISISVGGGGRRTRELSIGVVDDLRGGVGVGGEARGKVGEVVGGDARLDLETIDAWIVNRYASPPPEDSNGKRAKGNVVVCEALERWPCI